MITTDHGCTDETSRQLIVEPDFIFDVPNAFTPNADDVNDVLEATEKESNGTQSNVNF